MAPVPFRMIGIAVLMLAAAAFLLTMYDSDSSDATVTNGDCGKDGNNLTWEYDDVSHALTITGSGEMRDYNELDVQPWTECTSISLPDGMTSIGGNAFSDCTFLTSVDIPSSVTSIGHFAFSYCTSLASVTIPSSVTSIWGGVFDHCTSLSSVTIPSSVTSIGIYAFSTCTSLTSVDIPSSVTFIGYGAFEECTSLASVTIPSSVTSVEDHAFSYCTSLASVNVLSSVTSIGDNAFYNCSGLKTVTVPCTNPLGIEKGSDSNGYIAYYADDVVSMPHRLTAICTWEGIEACSVRVFCEDCDYLAGIENPEVKSKVKIPPTETEMGTTEYYVSGTVEGYDYYSSKDVKDIPVVVPGEDPEDDSIVLYAVIAVVAAIVFAGAALFLLRRPKSE